MARRRGRRSPVRSFLIRALAWLVASVVLFAAVVYVFQTAPWLGFSLFVGLPVAVLLGMVWFRGRGRRVAARRAAEQARLRVETARHIGPLLTGSGPEFELAVADVLRAHGYDLERVGGSGDRGVDLVGTDAEGWKVVVQCKRYGPDNKVGSPAVQSFMGTMFNQEAEHGIFVTTSTYTRQARELAASSRTSVLLIDGRQFTQMAAAAADGRRATSTSPALAVVERGTYRTGSRQSQTQD